MTMLRPQNNTHRVQLSLDGLWDFRVQLEGESTEGWSRGFPPDRTVGVPASFNEQFTDYDTYNHMGKVWYSRTFEIPEAFRNMEQWLYFAAVNYAPEVYLNGIHLGSHRTGYTPFAFPIDGAWTAGTNRLVVCVDCELTPHTVPQGGFDKAAIPGISSPFRPSVNFDFFPYSGIHRSVSLLALPRTRLESIYADTSVVEGTGCVSIRGEVSGASDRIGVHLEIGEIVLKTNLDEDGSFAAQIEVPNARLWDIGQPELYELKLRLVDTAGQILDSYGLSIGIRDIELRGDQLLLNGRPVYLQGFGKHEDFPVLGRHHHDAVNVRDLELLKWIGANSFRTSHYPYASEMLDLADRLGILVISESPAVSMIPEHASEETLELHCQTIREQMRRDYNHPSVILWCVANEAHSHTEAAVPYFEKVFEVARG